MAGEVTLKVAMDISSVTGTSNIGGISQPIIGQRKIEHEIRLKEGEVNILGGILEDSSTRAISGIPGLGNIPLLKYLFSQTNTQRSENEIVFALIPHIVRGPELSELNEKAIDVGTANAIELRTVSQPAKPVVPQAQPGVGAAPQPTPPPPAQNVPAGQPQAPPPTGNQQPGSAGFAFDPAAINVKAGSTFAVNLLLNGVQNVNSVPVQISYDPNKLQVVNISNGGFLSQDGQAVALVHRDDSTSGTLQVTASRPPGSGGISGQGSVITLTMMAKVAGQSSLAINKGGARDSSMQSIPVSGAQVTVNAQ
jgi:general secretion pathway protein D